MLRSIKENQKKELELRGGCVGALFNYCYTRSDSAGREIQINRTESEGKKGVKEKSKKEGGEKGVGGLRRAEKWKLIVLVQTPTWRAM